MKQILRYSFVALLAMVFCNAQAEDIIWQEDFSSYSANDVPSGGTYNYACENGGGTTKIWTESLAGGTSPELLVAKKGGSFTAVVPLGGKSGQLNISYKTNRTDLAIEVTGATVGEKVRSGNTDTYTLTVAGGTDNLTIKIYMPSSINSNARLDDIKLYQGTAKKPAGLSWGKASTTVTLGGDYGSIPTLSNSNNLPVTCTSSDEAVCTVSNAGVITVVGAGTTKISAVFEGNDEYEAQTVTIDITVNGVIDDNAKGGKNNPYNIEDLVADFMGGQLKSGTTIYVKGFITNIDEMSTQYGNATFKIATTYNVDAEYKLSVYRAKYLEKANFTNENQIKLGDEVIVNGKIETYNNEGRIASGGYIYSLNGNTSGINAVKADTEANAPAYNLAGQKVDNSYKGLIIKNGRKMIQK